MVGQETLYINLRTEGSSAFTRLKRRIVCNPGQVHCVGNEHPVGGSCVLTVYVTVAAEFSSNVCGVWYFVLVSSSSRGHIRDHIGDMICHYQVIIHDQEFESIIEPARGWLLRRDTGLVIFHTRAEPVTGKKKLVLHLNRVHKTRFAEIRLCRHGL